MVPVKMAKSVTIVAILYAIFRRTQQAAKVLASCHRLLRFEQQPPHSVYSTGLA